MIKEKRKITDLAKLYIHLNVLIIDVYKIIGPYKFMNCLLT